MTRSQSRPRRAKNSKPETLAAVLPDGTGYVDVNVNRRVFRSCWLWKLRTCMLHTANHATEVTSPLTSGVTPGDVYQITHEAIMPCVAGAPCLCVRRAPRQRANGKIARTEHVPWAARAYVSGGLSLYLEHFSTGQPMLSCRKRSTGQ